LEVLAITGMSAAAICWLLPSLCGMRAGQALEWRLLGVPLAAPALLIWLECLGAGGLAHWLRSLALIAVLDLGLRWTGRRVSRRPPAWAMTSAALVAAGLLAGGACTLPLDAVTASA
jgi:hypothetical protein